MMDVSGVCGLSDRSRRILSVRSKVCILIEKEGENGRC